MYQPLASEFVEHFEDFEPDHESLKTATNTTQEPGTQSVDAGPSSRGSLPTASEALAFERFRSEDTNKDSTPKTPSTNFTHAVSEPERTQDGETPGNTNRILPSQPSPIPSARPGAEQVKAKKAKFGLSSSVQDTLGTLALTVLTLGTLIIAGVMAFFSFLWFSDYHNSTWHWIVAHDHLNTLVTFLSEPLKYSVTSQIGVATAMLASIAIETNQVVLSDAASISMARASTGSGKLFSALKKHFKNYTKRGLPNGKIFLLVVLASLILVFTNFITAVLISDVRLAPVPGPSATLATPFGLAYHTVNSTNLPLTHAINHGTTWTRRPTFYPTFAEYSEEPAMIDDVDDTGLALRAFLPFSSQESRQNAQQYIGRTTVIDTRVTCQIPNLENETIEMPENDYGLILRGRFSSSQRTPRLDNSTLQFGVNATVRIYNQSVPFACLTPVNGDCLNEGSYGSNACKEWRTTICQLPGGGSGGLVSEFWPHSALNLSDPYISEAPQNWGVAYLVLNVTNGTQYLWELATQVGNSNAQPPPQISQHDTWRDLVFADGVLILSVTLCYASFMTADIPVKISSARNRTEPVPSFDFNSNKYNYQELRRMLGQESALSLSDRGLLQLENLRGSWLANATEYPQSEPYIRYSTNLAGPLQDVGNSGNYSAFLWEAPSTDITLDLPTMTPDITFVWLFQEILATGGSVAFALQSLYTVLAGLAYYDQLGQFDNVGIVDRAQFVAVNVPLRWQGFLAVAVVLICHFVLTSVVITWFFHTCKYSSLGDTWKAVAQARSAMTEDIFQIAPNKTKKEVKGWLKDEKRNNTRVGLGWIEDEGRPGIVKANVTPVADGIRWWKTQARLTKRKPSGEV
jgi:hypothetical protein